jgi:hypothetical protein
MLKSGSLLSLLLVTSACTGEIGDRGDTQGGGAGSSTPELAYGPATLYRLTEPQLHNAWLDLFGEPLDLSAALPVDDVAYGFTSIAAAQKTISPLEAEQYEGASYAVLESVWSDVARREALVGCSVTAISDACVGEFLADFATRAWRRPLAAGELESLLALAEQVAGELADPTEGLKFALAAVLQSPHFLFRVEIGEPDASEPGVLRYTSYEMASRLSFLLLDAPPDEPLREAAINDELAEVETIRSHAERLLADPRARPAMTRFFRDFMNIRNLDVLDKNPDMFPQFSATLGPSMRLEMEKMFESLVFDDGGDFRRLFTTDKTFVNEELAALYGIEGVTGEELVPVTLPASAKRAGILTAAGFLALNAHKTQTSPTHRGRFVRINLLCEDVPPPPPGVTTTLPEVDPDAPPQTLRQRLAIHVEAEGCMSCHTAMDPIGFAFEHYDAIGQYRDVDENGLTLDASSEVDGNAVNGGLEMGQLVADLPAVGACVARRFYEHAGAHLAGSGEDPSVDQLVEDFTASDFDFQSLVVALVTNDGFRFAAAADPAVDGEEEAGR